MKSKENTSGYTRVWLDLEQDRTALVNYYQEDPAKQVAIRLMLQGGLRCEEVTRITKNDLKKSDKADFTRLKIRESKTESRETVIPESLAQQIRTVSNIIDTDTIVNVTPRTIRNWVYTACLDLADQTGDPEWKYVSPHDLRRSWGTNLVQSGVPESNVMNWGGWENYETFQKHYFQESDEQIEKQLQRINYFQGVQK